MSNPHVRQIGRLEDLDGSVIAVGVDYDTVTIKVPPLSMHVARLTRDQAEQFAKLFVGACWEAATNGDVDG